MTVWSLSMQEIVTGKSLVCQDDGIMVTTPKSATAKAGRRSGKRDRLQPAERRVLLMGAAARTFARLGFAGTRMDDIAEEAQVAKGLLYRHFPSKEALFQALMEESGADFTRRDRAMNSRDPGA